MTQEKLGYESHSVKRVVGLVDNVDNGCEVFTYSVKLDISVFLYFNKSFREISYRSIVILISLP